MHKNASYYSLHLVNSSHLSNTSQCIPLINEHLCIYSCRRLILSGLLFFFRPWARLRLGSSLGLEPILLGCLFYRVFESFRASYLFRVNFHFFYYLNCYLCLSVISSKCHFVSFHSKKLF